MGDVGRLHAGPRPGRVGRRAEILAAARRALLERGVDALRVADIARLARVSSAAVHYHFDRKDDVVAAAFRWSSEQLFAEMDRRLQRCDGAADRIAVLLELSIPSSGPLRDEYVIWLQFWARLLNDRTLLPACEAVSRRWRSYFQAVVVEGARRGEFTLPAAPDEVADRLLALIDGLGFETVVGYSWATPDRMREMLRHFGSEQLGIPIRLGDRTGTGP